MKRVFKYIPPVGMAGLGAAGLTLGLAGLMAPEFIIVGAVLLGVGVLSALGVIFADRLSVSRQGKAGNSLISVVPKGSSQAQHIHILRIKNYAQLYQLSQDGRYQARRGAGILFGLAKGTQGSGGNPKLKLVPEASLHLTKGRDSTPEKTDTNLEANLKFSSELYDAHFSAQEHGEQPASKPQNGNPSLSAETVQVPVKSGLFLVQEQQNQFSVKTYAQLKAFSSKKDFILETEGHHIKVEGTNVTVHQDLSQFEKTISSTTQAVGEPTSDTRQDQASHKI